MTITFERARWSKDDEGYWLHLLVKEWGLAQKFLAVMKAGKRYAAELKEYRAKRSLDANAYLWVLLGKMAAVLGTDKDSVYLEMLERYGVYTHIVVRPELVERVRREWRTVRELGPVTVNGKTGVQLQCYFGSHSYDTKEMARLIDGVISECRDLEIETKTPAELDAMKEAWGHA